MIYVTGPVDLTRVKPVSHGSIGMCRVAPGRVNSFSNITGRVGSGQEVFKISRVRSGRVKTSKKLRGSGRVTLKTLLISDWSIKPNILNNIPGIVQVMINSTMISDSTI